MICKCFNRTVNRLSKLIQWHCIDFTKRGLGSQYSLFFIYVLLNINLFPILHFNLRLINHSKGMHYISSPINKKQCNHIYIVNLQNSILMDPRLCSMMLNPFGSLFPFFYFISRSLFPCLAFSSLFTLFFTCFSVFFPSLPLLFLARFIPLASW